MSIRRPHPQPDALRAFALGRLGMAEMEAIEAHLSDCPACGRRVQEAPDDDLVKLLHRGQAPARGTTHSA